MAQHEPTSDLGIRLRPGVRLGAVLSLYHRELTGAMLGSARGVLGAAGLEPKDLLVLESPGAFELPLLARRLALRPDIDAVLAFGLVLRGETTHDQHVARCACDGLLRVGLECDKPVLLGVLTCNTLEQARARALPAGHPELPAGLRAHDKGAEVARAALLALRALDELEEMPVITSRASSGSSAGFGLPAALHETRLRTLRNPK